MQLVTDEQIAGAHQCYGSCVLWKGLSIDRVYTVHICLHFTVTDAGFPPLVTYRRKKRNSKTKASCNQRMTYNPDLSPNRTGDHWNHFVLANKSWAHTSTTGLLFYGKGTDGDVVHHILVGSGFVPMFLRGLFFQLFNFNFNFDL